MATDFRVINDLTSEPYEGEKSPAHYTDEEREKELESWKEPRPIRPLSYATVGGRPFHFRSRSGCPAPIFSLTNPVDYLDIAQGYGLSAGTDISYRFCYRACAGGPLKWPKVPGKVTRVLGPLPPQPIELWDNDGIVSYDSLKSSPLFKTNTFDKVWTEIFFFAAMPKVFAQNRDGQHIPVKIAAAAAVAC